MKISNFNSQFSNFSRGFTLVEILLFMGIAAVLASFAVVNLIRPQTKASLDGVVLNLASDLKSQQIKAMVGDSGSGTTAQAQGIYFQSNQYTLFKGDTYSGADTDNFTVSESSDINISTSFPSSEAVFLKGSGEISDFTGGSNTITISSGGESRTISINRYGVLSIN